MTIKISYPKISLAIAFTLSTSIGSRAIYTFSNDFSSSCYTFSNDFSVVRRTFSNDFYHPPKVVNIEKVVKLCTASDKMHLERRRFDDFYRNK